jgi:hypothetical protein
VALVAAILCTALVLALGTAMLTMSTSELRATTAQGDDIRLRNVAEAGVDRAFHALNANPALGQAATTLFTNEALTARVDTTDVPLGAYTVTVAPEGTAGNVVVTATSVWPGAGAPNAQQKTLRVTAYPKKGGPLFGAAAFGEAGVNIESGLIDSYDSANGAYHEKTNKNENGHIQTNSANPLSMTAKTNGQKGQVDGNVIYGPGTNLLIATYPKDQLSGSLKVSPSPVALAGVTVPSGLTNLGNVSGGTINAGTYKVTGITGAPTIKGRVVLYCDGDIVIKGNEDLRSDSGKPRDLIIYGTENCRKIEMKGNPTITAGIYAPNAAVDCAGGGKPGTSGIYGAIVAASVNFSQHFNVHYDEQLGKLDGFATGYALKSWAEM